MVGPDEECLETDLKYKGEQTGARIRWFGPTLFPEHYMAAADIFVLPSYREGFGTVIIEAAACGLPTIGYRIIGVVDAVVEEYTGCLVNKGDIRALIQVMDRVGSDRKILFRMGQAAKNRVKDNFSSTAVSTAWLSFYKSVLQSKA